MFNGKLNNEHKINAIEWKKKKTAAAATTCEVDSKFHTNQ